MPLLKEKLRKFLGYWLDLDEDRSERFDDASWARLADAYPMLGRYVRDCG